MRQQRSQRNRMDFIGQRLIGFNSKIYPGRRWFIHTFAWYIVLKIVSLAKLLFLQSHLTSIFNDKISINKIH